MTRAMGLAPEWAETRHAAQGVARRPGDARKRGRRPDSPTTINSLDKGVSE